MIADATATISTYTGTNLFNVDTTAFQNAFTGTFTVVRGDSVGGGDDSQLYLSYSDEAPPVLVPEPSSIALALFGLLGMAWSVRRRG